MSNAWSTSLRDLEDPGGLDDRGLTRIGAVWLRLCTLRSCPPRTNVKATGLRRPRRTRSLVQSHPGRTPSPQRALADVAPAGLPSTGPPEQPSRRAEA